MRAGFLGVRLNVILMALCVPEKMTRLEYLQPTAALRGILPDQLVTVVSVQ
jgi:hypothetical protein